MKFVFQTSVNGIRQKEQAVIKQACQKAGIELELKAVSASVFFSSDVGNPDTNTKFWCDMQMFTALSGGPDPALLHEPLHHGRDRQPGPTSGRAATSRAGAATNTTGSTRRPRASWTRSSARRSSSR